jgi:hypothetical protein
VQVKVNNQYTLQEGERSVFDEELGDIIKTNSKLYDKPLPKKTAAPRQARYEKFRCPFTAPLSLARAFHERSRACSTGRRPQTHNLQTL